MNTIRNPRVLWIKGALFVATGVMSLALLWLECLSVRTVVFSLLACWCFARAYYFAFYVIEHYVDPGFRFAGLPDVWRYWRKYGFSRTVPPSEARAWREADGDSAAPAMSVASVAPASSESPPPAIPSASEPPAPSGRPD